MKSNAAIQGVKAKYGGLWDVTPFICGLHDFYIEALHKFAARQAPFEAALGPLIREHRPSDGKSLKTLISVGFKLDDPIYQNLVSELYKELSGPTRRELSRLGWKEQRATTHYKRSYKAVQSRFPNLKTVAILLADVKKICEDGARTMRVEGFVLAENSFRSLRIDGRQQFAYLEKIPFRWWT